MKTLNSSNMMYRVATIGLATLLITLIATPIMAQSKLAKRNAGGVSAAHTRIDGLKARLVKLEAAHALTTGKLKVQIKVEINKLNVKITKIERARKSANRRAVRSARSARRANRKAKRATNKLLQMRITSAVDKAKAEAAVDKAKTTSHTTLGKGSQELSGLAFGVIPTKKQPKKVQNGARKAAARTNGKQKLNATQTSAFNACIAQGGSPRIVSITDRYRGDATFTEVRCDMPKLKLIPTVAPVATKSDSDSKKKGVTTKSILVSCGIGALGGGSIGVVTPGVMQGMGHEVSGTDYGVGAGAGAAGGCAVGVLLHLAGVGQ